MKKFRRIVIIIIIITIAICILMCVVMIIINKKFTSNMKKCDGGKAEYQMIEDGYILNYKKASLLNPNPFACICREKDCKMVLTDEGVLKTEGMTIVVYIWPSLFDNKFGVYFMEHDTKNIELQVEITSEAELCSDNVVIYDGRTEMLASDLIDEYKDVILEYIGKAKEKWRL